MLKKHLFIEDYISLIGLKINIVKININIIIKNQLNRIVFNAYSTKPYS